MSKNLRLMLGGLLVLLAMCNPNISAMAEGGLFSPCPKRNAVKKKVAAIAEKDAVAASDAEVTSLTTSASTLSLHSVSPASSQSVSPASRSASAVELIRGPFHRSYAMLSPHAKGVVWQMAFQVLEYAVEQSPTRSWEEDVAAAFKDGFVGGAGTALDFYRAYVFDAFDQLKEKVAALVPLIHKQKTAPAYEEDGILTIESTGLFTGALAAEEFDARLIRLAEWVGANKLNISQAMFPLEESAAWKLALAILEEAIFTEEADIRYVVRPVIEKFARDNRMRKEEQAYNFCNMYVAPRIKVLQRAVMPVLVTNIVEIGHELGHPTFTVGLSAADTKFFKRLPAGEALINQCEMLAYDMVADKSLISDDAREVLKRDEKLTRLLDKLAGTIVEW